MEGIPYAEIRSVESNAEEYPKKLKNYPNMPKKLYVTGSLPKQNRFCVAVVGARMCSAYGRTQAFVYARELSRNGIQIISGLALGIDAEAHKGAMEGGTPTFAVMGCGPDICYPTANRNIYEKIVSNGGGILSEYPPETPPQPWTFPARNRIISALADLVLIVEAKEKSGALITANWALEQGKTVYALPGAVNDALSQGCHKLIYDGAGIAYCPEVLLEELGISEKRCQKTAEKKKLGLAQDLDLVYSCLDLRPKNQDSLIRETGLSSGVISRILVELELMGLVKETGRHYYIRS